MKTNKLTKDDLVNTKFRFYLSMQPDIDWGIKNDHTGKAIIEGTTQDIVQLIDALRFFVLMHSDDYEYLDKGIGKATSRGQKMLDARKLIEET
jgi:hypothetical protein